MKTLIERQYENEEVAINLGIANYVATHRKTVARGDASSLAPENYLLRECVIPFSESLKAHCMANRRGDTTYHRTRKIIIDTGFDTAAFIAFKVCLELEKPTPMVKVAGVIANQIKMHLDYVVFKKAMPGYLKKLEDTMDSKTPDYKIKVIRHYMDKKAVPTYDMGEDRTNLGMFLLIKMVEAVDVFELTLKRSGKKTLKYLQKTPLTRMRLEEAHDTCAIFSVQYLPMLIKPSPWTSMYDGGFLNCAGQYRIPVVRQRDKEAREMIEKTESMKRVYASLNALQDTAFRINRKVLDVMQVCREHSLAGLPATDIKLELPSKFWTTTEEYNELAQEEPQRIKEWKIGCSREYDKWHRAKSKRNTLHWQLWTADRFKDEPEIYYVYNVDWRGRFYPLQPYLNCQSDCNGKALLEFANGKPLGIKGAYWMAIHGANAFGMDKADLPDRIKWVNENTELIMDAAENPLGGSGAWMDADEPFMFLAFCFEWAQYLKEGDSFVSNLPVSIDGSCSGLQHYSAMMRDEIGGQYVNLIPQSKKADIYMKVAEIGTAIVAKDTTNPLAECWNGRIDRDIAKKNAMTYAYSATLYGFAEQLKELITKKRGEGVVYVEDSLLEGKATMYMARVNLQAIENVVVKAAETMAWFKDVAEIVALSGNHFHWVTPSGMFIKQIYRKMDTLRINTVVGGTRIRTTVGVPTDTPHVNKHKLGIAPNFTHGNDASHVSLTVNECKKEGIDNFFFIHDSFGCLAGDMDDMNRILRETFIEMYSVDVLAGFLAQLKEQLPTDVYAQLPEMPKKGNLDLNQVRDSLYFFA